MPTTTCHCGLVKIEVAELPSAIIDCNCSICRRYGALWAYYTIGTIRVTGHPENTVDYVWGDKTLRTLRCRHCGCVTHWEPLEPKGDARVGVNARNFDPSELKAIPIRRLDGADTWTYID